MAKRSSQRFEDTLSPEDLLELKKIARSGATHSAIGERFGTSGSTISIVKQRLKIFVPSRGRVYPEGIKTQLREQQKEYRARVKRETKRPQADTTSQQKERMCNATGCGNKFISEHFGHRNCGCNKGKSLSVQELYS